MLHMHEDLHIDQKDALQLQIELETSYIQEFRQMHAYLHAF